MGIGHQGESSVDDSEGSINCRGSFESNDIASGDWYGLSDSSKES